MPLFGSHLSIAGGYYRAANKAGELGFDTVQIFTKNNNRWDGKALTDEDVRLFRDAVDANGLKSPCSHDSYLINLASPDPALWQKSVDAYVVELERAERLGLEGVVMHPGSFVKSTEEEGLNNIVKAFDEVHRRTPKCSVASWLETTAGQGTNLGHRFEHLAFLIEQIKENERLGVCVDTCHIFAAGYGLKTREEYNETMDSLEQVIGLSRIKAFHLNDSKKEQGSRVDRHEHLGEGCLGLEPFEFLVNDSRFADLPMYLETKKEKRDDVEMDVVNLQRLKSLQQEVN